MARAPKPAKQIDALKHDAASRRNIPTAEMESFFRRDEDRAPREPKHYPRSRPLAEGATRTVEEPSQPELIWNGARISITPDQMEELARTGTLTLSDAQLVWRGKDRQDWSDLVVNVPPLYIQEKIHPKAIIDDLKRQTTARAEPVEAPDMFADFNGIAPDARAEFYQHDQHWSNRMILGDSLQVMASLAERESLKGKVQCIYFDPPYGIKFNSNWQVSTQSRDVKDGKQADISREPEQVKAFRDTWKDGIHSYLTYLRDRLTVMRDLLTDSGSIFVQIGGENVHRVRAVMDEVFGEDNFVSQISVYKTSTPSKTLDSNLFYVIWYAKSSKYIKCRSFYLDKPLTEWTSETKGGSWGVTIDNRDRPLAPNEKQDPTILPLGASVYQLTDMFSAGEAKNPFELSFRGDRHKPRQNTHWKTTQTGVERLGKIGRLEVRGGRPWYKRYHSDWPNRRMTNVWSDTSGKANERLYIVQTQNGVIERCILMATDPGDLVLDPTCGSGTTAYVAEQWGRRWITIDTSRVALALARTRIMAARYPWYLLTDSKEGRAKEAALTQRVLADTPVRGDIRQGFVYERVPHITLKSIANNPLIDDICDKWQEVLEPLRRQFNSRAREFADQARAEHERQNPGIIYSLLAPRGDLEEWEMPRDLPSGEPWPEEIRELLTQWWQARIARQQEIDASIAARADVDFLYDKPYQDTARVRVAGPFTVESLSPHRVLPASEAELVDELDADAGQRTRPDAGAPSHDFAAIVIDYLRGEGVKQQAKGDRIAFDHIAPWPGGKWIGAEATFIEGENGPERRAAILIGPEYGTVGRQDLVAAAREAVDARFDVLIACAFNFDALSSELGNLGSLPILKARINPDMHMSAELKNTGRGNMFVVFGEPDVKIIDHGGSELRVKVNGVDVFDPNTGAIRSDGASGIAAWFIDTDYNEESFFVRHAYFLGANDPYKSLKTALKAEIDEEAWATLYADTSRPFERPSNRKIAVKVINHFGDEVMKVFGV